MYYAILGFIATLLVAHLIGGAFRPELANIGAAIMVIATMGAIWRLTITVNQKRNVVAGEACLSLALAIMILTIGLEAQFLGSVIAAMMTIGPLWALAYQVRGLIGDFEAKKPQS